MPNPQACYGPEGTLGKAEAVPRSRLMSECQLRGEQSQSWRGKHAFLGSDFGSSDLNAVLLDLNLAPSLSFYYTSVLPL